MISCSRATKLLHLYSDSCLDVRHFAPLEAHLRTCAACQRELAWLELVSAACDETVPVIVPAGLAERVMAYITYAEAEQQREHTAVAASHRAFALHWGDGVLAALLASVSTLLFTLLDPHLRAFIGGVLFHLLPNMLTLLLAPGPGSFAWAAWIVWVAAGLGLAITLAGAEVRSLWRRSLTQRLPQLHQLW